MEFGVSSRARAAGQGAYSACWRVQGFLACRAGAQLLSRRGTAPSPSRALRAGGHGGVWADSPSPNHHGVSLWHAAVCQR